MSHTHHAHSCRHAIGTWRLHPGHAMSLRPRQTAVLRIFCGRVWVTQGQRAGASPESAGDRFLGPGDVLAVPAGTRLVMEPMTAPGDAGPVHFDWSDAVAPSRFATEVVSPSRELAAALGQACGAAVRVLRGLLGYSEFLVAGRGRALGVSETRLW